MCDSIQYVLYYGGPYFESYHLQFDTAAMYNAIAEPAIIVFPYGHGEVVLSGVHPEIEEDDDRDSTDFASELADSGSDWEWFMYIVLQALAHSSLDENLTSDYPPAAIDKKMLIVTKNELSDFLSQHNRGTLYTVSGKVVTDSNLHNGIYFFTGEKERIVFVVIK